MNAAHLTIGDQELRVASTGQGPPELVLLHDGLGSIEQWRSLPADLAAATGLRVMAYDRRGHGRSTPAPSGPWPTDWLHREAEVLGALLAEVGATDPVLVGHSDGGSIAALYAATTTTASPLVLLAPHSWVESAARDAIEAMRGNRASVIAGLARFHQAPTLLFDAWSGVWTSEPFSTWDIRGQLADIKAPTLVLQGTADEFATDEQATSTAAAIGANATCRLVDNLRHVMHHHRPEEVIGAVAGHLESFS